MNADIYRFSFLLQVVHEKAHYNWPNRRSNGKDVYLSVYAVVEIEIVRSMYNEFKYMNR